MKVTPRKISAPVAPSARTLANVRTVSFANICLICNIPSASHCALCDNTTCQVWWTAATSGSRKSPRTFPRTQSNCKLNIFYKYFSLVKSTAGDLRITRSRRLGHMHFSPQAVSSECELTIIQSLLHFLHWLLQRFVPKQAEDGVSPGIQQQ